jgi:hypothetical protein
MKRHIDLSKCESSVTSRLFILLKPEYHKLPLLELKDLALEILDDPGTSVSVHKKREIRMNIERTRYATQLQTYITNLSMRGSNLSLKS